MTGYLKDNGVRSHAFHGSLEIHACVPVPLLAPLSELPGVYTVGFDPPSLPDSPTLLEGASLGAIKDRFK